MVFISLAPFSTVFKCIKLSINFIGVKQKIKKSSANFLLKIFYVSSIVIEVMRTKLVTFLSVY